MKLVLGFFTFHHARVWRSKGSWCWYRDGSLVVRLAPVCLGGARVCVCLGRRIVWWFLLAARDTVFVRIRAIPSNLLPWLWRGLTLREREHKEIARRFVARPIVAISQRCGQGTRLSVDGFLNANNPLPHGAGVSQPPYFSFPVSACNQGRQEGVLWLSSIMHTGSTISSRSHTLLAWSRERSWLEAFHPRRCGGDFVVTN